MMDYANERYVRLYVRDTVTWKLLSWEARALLAFAIRKADRAGVIDHGGAGPRGLAAIVEMPVDVVARALPELLAGDDSPVVESDGAYVIPNYLAAQEATASTPQRQRELRGRRRDHKLAAQRGLFPDDVTKRDGSAWRSGDPDQDDAEPVDLDQGGADHEGGTRADGVTKERAGVTNRDRTATPTVTRGHAESRRVTPDLAVPDYSDPGRTEPDLQEQLGGDRERAPRPKTAAAPDAFMALPCIAGEEFVVTGDMVAEWKTTYPALNVEVELRRARQWSLDNPQKRKTVRGARKFLGGWLDRQQDRGRLGGGGGGRGATWSRALERAEERDRKRTEPDVDDRPPPEDQP